jgi:hypothetical protein
MTNELKPNILQMLEIGRECGLTYLEEAHYNYMNHYDCFFLIDKFQEQCVDFTNELVKYDLVGTDEDGILFLKSISIEHAIKQIKEYENGQTV